MNAKEMGSLKKNVPDEKVSVIDYFGPFTFEKIEEDVMEDIKRESAQTGECYMAIAQRFIDYMNELGSTAIISPGILKLWRYWENPTEYEEDNEVEYKKVV